MSCSRLACVQLRHLPVLSWLDQMDTRDHREYEKTIQRMRESRAYICGCGATTLHLAGVGPQIRSAGDLPSNASPSMIQALVMLPLLHFW